MTTLARRGLFDPIRLTRTADALAVAVAVSLPWSTSATGILVVLWLLPVFLTLDWPDVRRTVLTPAGGLPVLLVVLGVLGMLWADVSWAERWGGVESFFKLLVIPLLLVQFRRSDRGLPVFAGYVVSCAVLLAISTLVEFVPGFSFIPMHYDYVVVKNSPTQSGEFVTCIFGLLFLTVQAFEGRRWPWVLGLLAVILGMLANIFYVATGRTALVIIPVLLTILAAKKLSGKGVCMLLAGAILVGGIGWLSSQHLRDRITQIWTDYQKFEATDERNSSGERIEFARKSIEFIRQAPIFGHGTGSIHALFIKSSIGQTGAEGSATTNPHNQTFAVAIQLGLVGALVLWAMWIAHLMVFRGNGLVEWIGLVVIVQNVVGSLFNSHLFDFTQGWVYVFGVGVAGGMALKHRAVEKSSAAAPAP
jgi:O-antigen ligase